MRALVAWLVLLALGGCALFRAPPPGIGDPVSFDDLPGWEQDRHAEAWPALLQTCARLGNDATWQGVCAVAATLTPDDARARQFFEYWFVPHRVHGPERARTGLITGYYEPILFGSFSPDARFRYPVYRRPDDLITVDLTALFPELRGRPVRGRLQGNRLVPYYDRNQIGARARESWKGRELLWVDDDVALFFLQIQGSGRVVLPDGSEVGVGYADQNGHPYVPLGRCFIERGILPREQVNLFTLREWLRTHPNERAAMLDCNPSYVFFELREANGDGPLGSLRVPLTPERSVATDPAFIAGGLGVWLDTTLPDGSAFRRLTFAQDTGGAIRGPIRADVFFGRGERAERLAGEMRQTGALYVLRPRAQTMAQTPARPR